MRVNVKSLYIYMIYVTCIVVVISNYIQSLWIQPYLLIWGVCTFSGVVWIHREYYAELIISGWWFQPL